MRARPSPSLQPEMLALNKRLRKRIRLALSKARFGALLPIVAFLLGFFLRKRPCRAITDSAVLAHHSISSNDVYTTAAETFAFIFATGRSGTQHLSLALTPRRSPPTYITHEEEHLSWRTRAVVAAEYRPLVQEAQAKFNTSASAFVADVKLPFYRALLARHSATRLVYTGHVPMAFGLGPSLVRALGGGVRIVRLRRDRVATAASLMALGPQQEDPWAGGDDAAPLSRRRWFPTPSDAHVRLRVAPSAWVRMNRFQRWLWYVDDVECRWQALRAEFGHRFSWMEESLEALSVFDGGAGWRRLAEFIGVDVDWNRVNARDNSIQHKGREKLDVAEGELRKWDSEYRDLVGRCEDASGASYGWDYA